MPELLNACKSGRLSYNFGSRNHLIPSELDDDTEKVSDWAANTSYEIVEASKLHKSKSALFERPLQAEILQTKLFHTNNQDPCLNSVNSSAFLSKLQEHEQQMILALTRDVLFLIVGNSCEVEIMSESLCQILGYTSIDEFNKSLMNLIHPNDQGTVLQYREKMKAGDYIKHLEVRLRNSTDDYLCFEWAGHKAPNGYRYVILREVTREKSVARRLKRHVEYLAQIVKERNAAVEEATRRELLLRTITDSLPHHILCVSANTLQVNFMNREMLRVYDLVHPEWPPERVRQLISNRAPLEQIMNEAEMNIFLEQFGIVGATKSPYRVLNKIPNSEITMDARFLPIFSDDDGENEIEDIVFICEDISDKIRAEDENHRLNEQLKKSHNQLELITNSIPFIIVAIDPESGEILFSNKATHTAKSQYVVGTTEKYFTMSISSYKTIYDIPDSTVAEFIKRYMKQVVETKSIVPFDEKTDWLHNLSDPHGSERYLKGWFLPLLSDDGSKVIQVVLVSRDVTQRKRDSMELERLNVELKNVLQEVHDSEKRFRIITNRIPLIICLFDAKTLSVKFSNEFGQNYRKANKLPSFYPGILLNEMYNERFMQLFLPFLQQMMSNREAVSYEIELEWNQGDVTHILNGSLIPLVDGVDDTIGECVHVVRDVTLERRAAAEKMQLIASEQSAREASRLKTEFLLHVSHELRTPLTGLLGLMELISSSAQFNEHQQQLFEQARASGRILMSSVCDLLDLSIIEANTLGLRSEPFDIKLAIEECVQVKLMEVRSSLTLLEPGCLSCPRFVITTDIDPSIQKVRGMADRNRFLQILGNLISNSFKYAKDPSDPVKVIAVVEEKFARISVTDTGRGIDESKRKTLFNAFEQGSSLQMRTRDGIGIGLTIVKWLVERMGGKMDYTSDLHQGTSFCFTIPVVANNENDATPQIGTLTKDLVCDWKKYRALVVDDNPVNRQVLGTYLKRLGMEIELAVDGMDAAERIESGKSFDLILMDLLMPRLDGYGATEKIRELESEFKSYKRTPIIAVTANAVPEDEARCLSVGMNAYVTKPINFERFKQNIIEALNSIEQRT